MRRPPSVPLAWSRFRALGAAGVSLSVSYAAHAADTAPPPAPSSNATSPVTPPAPAPVPPAPVAEEPSFPGVNRYWRDDHLRRVAINLNPAALLIGRFSADLQVIPFRHHAIVLTPFYTSWNAAVFTHQEFSNSVGAAGFEAGYHFYGGDRGPNGFFLGPGLIYEHERIGSGTNFDALGWFIDAGVQGVTDSGFMAGFGFGLQWKHRVDGTAWVTAPRVLVMFGYAI